VSIIGNHFHTTKSYLRNNILSGTPGHKEYGKKALTVLETARLSVKDKKIKVFVYTQKKDFCELYWKNEGMEECCQRWDIAEKTSLQRRIFSHQVKQHVCQLFCCQPSKNFEMRGPIFYFTTLFITFVIQRRRQEKELGIWSAGGMRITGDKRSDSTHTINTTWTGLG
jgi:hypothetical protein